MVLLLWIVITDLQSMPIAYSVLLFAVTFIGGSIPLWIKGLDSTRMNYLLAFSGSFLLSITLLHLLPETFKEIGSVAGIYLLAGFFIQLLIQRITHGVEHGHAHLAHGHSIPLLSIMAGLSLHAFMEGLPLGMQYSMIATQPSLYMAVAAHKLPEAMLIASITLQARSKQTAWYIVALFSAITPVAAMLTYTAQATFASLLPIGQVLVPIVAGAFIHIATTIFYESGTQQHSLSKQKIAAIITGVAAALATLLLH
jgi:zinc and cadmium transporter